MEARQILCDARVLLDDEVPRYRHATAELLGYLNNGVAETCERTRAIQDSTSALCSITFDAGATQVAIDPRIYVVRRARIAGEVDALGLTNADILDANFPGWDDPDLQLTLTPTFGVFDLDQHVLRFNGAAAAAGTLRLTVWRRPLEDEVITLADLSAAPATPEATHRHLKHWIAFEALSQKDAEKGDAQKAAEQYNLFEQFIGKKADHHTMRLWSTSRIRGTGKRPHFF
jgi:hypothetical protein